MTDQGSDAMSASTETLSDLEDRIPSEWAMHNRRPYTESFDATGGSGSESIPEIEDSEATVTDMDSWESGSEKGDVSISLQPSQRLTARQQARQERLLQGIQQTQWNDMRLPRGLDLRHKAKKELLSEEQHLRRVKAAEVRRVQTQKAKRDTMEITKARIRAASSNKFRDILSNSTNEKTKIARTHKKGLGRGQIRFRHRADGSVLILPQNYDQIEFFKPKALSEAPCRKLRLEFDLEDGFHTNYLELGLLLNVKGTQDGLVLMKEEFCLGNVTSPSAHKAENLCGTITSIRFNSTSKQPRSITLLVKSNLSTHTRSDSESRKICKTICT